MTNDQVQPKVSASPDSAPRSSRKWIAIAIGGGCALLACAGLVVALAITLLRLVNRQTSSAPTPVLGTVAAATEAASGVQQAANGLGDPNAPVKIIEYADFQCPYCRLYWQETEPQIIEMYVKTGKVYYEFRSVGGFLGEESQAAAEAAYCAGDQGKFWQYHDSLFAHWSGENVGDFAPDKLKQYAATVGLDQMAFEQCLTSGKQADRVRQDVENAKSDGIKATPSFLINGHLLEGAEPFEAFKQIIDQALPGT